MLIADKEDISRGSRELGQIPKYASRVGGREERDY